jgi:hypothetical protein
MGLNLFEWMEYEWPKFFCLVVDGQAWTVRELAHRTPGFIATLTLPVHD